MFLFNFSLRKLSVFIQIFTVFAIFPLSASLVDDVDGVRLQAAGGDVPPVLFDVTELDITQGGTANFATPYNLQVEPDFYGATGDANGQWALFADFYETGAGETRLDIGWVAIQNVVGFFEATLEFTDLEWGAVVGSVDNVTFIGGDFGGAVVVTPPSSFTISTPFIDNGFPYPDGTTLVSTWELVISHGVPIPEPSTYLLMSSLLGFVVFLAYRRRLVN